MKRISLMLALFLTLSFSVGFAQTQGDIYLSSVTGLHPVTGGLPDNPVAPAEFVFNFRNNGGDAVLGMTNGFEISGSGGITWIGTHATHSAWEGAVDFDLLWSEVEFSWTGSGADTIAFGGSIMSGEGMEAGLDHPVFILTIDASGAALGEEICIDSAYYPPTGRWLWDYGSSIGAAGPTWDGPHCYTVEHIDNLCPEFVLAPATGGADHCDLVVLQFTAEDNEDDPISFTIVSGSGAIDGSGQYTYAATLADVGASVGATIGIGDPSNGDGCKTTDLVLNFTNQAPTIVCGGGIPVGMGNTGTVGFTTDDVDCDPSNVTFTVSPTPAGNVAIVGNDVVFNSVAPDDGGTTYTVTVTVSDGVDQSSCDIEFEVLQTEPYEVQIEKTHNTLQGMHVVVDVTLNKGSEAMGGYDFMIAYDASALNFQAAIPGDFHTTCGWEYFNYRFGPNGNCGGACPAGMLEVIALAETNNGPNHPDCFKLDAGAVLFSLDFLVSDDRTLECMYAPVRFFWTNCTDNSIAYHPTDDPLASVQGVSRFVVDFDLIGHIEDGTTGFPTYTGVQDDCLEGGGPGKPAPLAFVDFYNGGVDIVCADSIDARGDLNLNGVSNEIADAVVFSNYFVQGLSVFTVDIQGQIAASDVNADGLTLSVADLVYLIRVIVGDALPYPKLGAEAASYAYENGTMSVDTKMGAAFVVVEGNVNPTLLADNMDMSYQFDGRNTRVLVSKIERGAGFDGDFLSFDGRVVSVEFATYDGAPVAQKNVPTSYSLAQNYPNPFNGMTKIAFGMPTAGDYTLSIYNVTGQKVADFSGTSEAGSVTVSWDASNQASGVYFYKLDTQNFTDTKKMVYLK